MYPIESLVLPLSSSEPARLPAGPYTLPTCLFNNFVTSLASGGCLEPLPLKVSPG